ncbi:MAG: hypothetical protein GY778_23380 [bacterium]|nr:hypothetical protein [bacterium]
MAVFDDGGGSELYVGGDIEFATGIAVDNIARWDGLEWSALGPGPSGDVSAIAVFDDGNGPALYAGGNFETAAGVTVNNIAKWDGQAWLPLDGPSGAGVEITGFVLSLAVYDDGSGPALYVGGRFDTAGGVTVNNIARWDGDDWSALATSPDVGTSSNVYSLAVYDDGGGASLYAGGSFDTAGGVTVNHVAEWDGKSWSGLTGPGGTWTNDWVYAMAVYDSNGGTALFVAGRFNFTMAGGVTVNRIARWDGSDWSALIGPAGNGIGSLGNVNALAVYDHGNGAALYAAGRFESAGGITVNHIARWDGTTWSALAGASGTGIVSTGEVEALAVYDGSLGSTLYAGGFFDQAGGTTANRIAQWDGANWSNLSGPSGAGVDDWVFALAVYDDGGGPDLYAGGRFRFAGGARVDNIARWNGSTWSSLDGPSGTGTDGLVRSLAVYDDGSGPKLYVGGELSTAGGVAVRNIARWDGTSWSGLSDASISGPDGLVDALGVYDDGSGPALYAAGDFETLDGLTVNSIATWNGAAWSELMGPGGAGVRGLFSEGRVQALGV